MDQKIIDLYDEYTHKPLNRQVFIKKLAKITGGVAMAMSILPMLENNYAMAAGTAMDDLISEEIEYDGANGKMKGYLVKPKGQQGNKYGAVVVIHENRGLNKHIKEVANRFAKDGFLVLAIDALSPLGGTPEDEDKARQMIADLDKEANLRNYLAGLEYVRGRTDTNGKTACVGFCWGGGLASDLAINDASLNAAVSYYGRQPDLARVGEIQANLLLHYAGLDERINEGIPAYEEALKKHQIKYNLYIYEGVNHAFNNDTSPARYNEDASKLAWQRTLSLFNEQLKN